MLLVSPNIITLRFTLLHAIVFMLYVVYMYVHALTPPACDLSIICNKVLFCSTTLKIITIRPDLPSQL